MWPRGFPLDYVQAQETFNKTIVVKTLHGFVQCMRVGFTQLFEVYKVKSHLWSISL